MTYKFEDGVAFSRSLNDPTLACELVHRIDSSAASAHATTAKEVGGFNDVATLTKGVQQLNDLGWGHRLNILIVARSRFNYTLRVVEEFDAITFIAAVLLACMCPVGSCFQWCGDLDWADTELVIVKRSGPGAADAERKPAELCRGANRTQICQKVSKPESTEATPGLFSALDDVAGVEGDGEIDKACNRKP